MYCECGVLLFGDPWKFSAFMMPPPNGNILRVTGHLWGESTGPRWIPLTKAGDTELWCFLWSAPEQTVEQTLETLVSEAWMSIDFSACNKLSCYVNSRCHWGKWRCHTHPWYLSSRRLVLYCRLHQKHTFMCGWSVIYIYIFSFTLIINELVTRGRPWHDSL